MTLHGESGSSNRVQAELPEAALRELRDGILLLWRARNYTKDAGVDLWDFAVEIHQFYSQGLSDNELRWLIAKGYAKHGQETSAPGDAHRSFSPSNGLSFSQATALVLTESGADFASQVCAAEPKAMKTASLDAGPYPTDDQPMDRPPLMETVGLQSR